MSVEFLREHIQEHWTSIRSFIEDGTYKPLPVRRIEILKPNGGVWLLGIPTVFDRFVQQAIAQILTPLFDPCFSDCSYGFRPGKRGHDDKQILKLIRRYLQSGIMVNGLRVSNEQGVSQGVSQGGPLSSLLSNIMLDVLDKELEKRGHRFVRYLETKVSRIQFYSPLPT
ncbi:reverse transcriptase (RNA-dependent DNA polymerase) [Baia soyae]|uniref:Reverse transcriptase (RNA-dependent DNA polymerase) n=1 Tax=Baia soyae TaxID=1544746 RepID=A0A4R2RQQ9_9BACL|nr:reverse transcriptase (RNA-dependent DNA polymerase) [Baia soyae]